LRREPSITVSDHRQALVQARGHDVEDPLAPDFAGGQGLQRASLVRLASAAARASARSWSIAAWVPVVSTLSGQPSRLRNPRIRTSGKRTVISKFSEVRFRSLPSRRGTATRRLYWYATGDRGEGQTETSR